MIKLEGTLEKVFESQTFNNFEKRVFWLKDIDEKYPNTWQLELWKKDCSMIDNYKVGDFVTCYIDIKGRHWEKKDNEGVINTLKCWNIEKDGKAEKPLQ